MPKALSARAVKGGGHKERELPADFWPAAKLSFSDDPSRLAVRHKGREPGFSYQSDVERLWPANNRELGGQRRRRSISVYEKRRGRKA